MKLTKKPAVALHRRLWNWVADETERQQRIVHKYEYPLFKHLAIDNDCWCCEYARNACKCVEEHACIYCFLKWKNGICLGSEYTRWIHARTWQEAVYWARVIAALPERKDIK